MVEALELDNLQISVRVRTRIGSLWVWLSGRTISPSFKERGLSEGKAGDAIAAIQALNARMSGSETSGGSAPTAYA